MHRNTPLNILPLMALSVCAAPFDAVLEVRASSSTCASYTIINTRGTGEAQGPSAGFTTINSQVTSQVSGGTIYNTVYAADASQNSEAGTQDIINKVTSTLQSSPGECFILQGYSQGAAATVNALSGLTGTSFDAVKGVFLIGDPEHKSGLACNVDTSGGTTTKDVNGLSVALGNSIPDAWIEKTLDVCAYGDGVCDTTHGFGINAEHLSYPTDSNTQKLGTDFAVKQLGGSA
ncbi:putative A cutinase-like protein from cryptococcus Sp [Seiridium unicorne]|uniref:A cutinase-like protein from cryptococcus Sp n=1 Tax=Seiridium unicorne TaxID=138068 RepID=A0ABR2VGK7_9PEZI